MALKRSFQTFQGLLKGFIVALSYLYYYMRPDHPILYRTFDVVRRCLWRWLGQQEPAGTTSINKNKYNDTYQNKYDDRFEVHKIAGVVVVVVNVVVVVVVAVVAVVVIVVVVVVVVVACLLFGI